MPNFALWIHVLNLETDKMKKYHTALNFKPKRFGTISTIPLHGTKKKIRVEHGIIQNKDDGSAVWIWEVAVQKRPIVAIIGHCHYNKDILTSINSVQFRYKHHSITIS